MAGSMFGLNRSWILGLVALAGCHTAPRVPPEPIDPTSNVRLTGAQVADVQVALGQTLERRGDTEAAAKAYDAAIASDGKRIDALARRAVLADQQGKFTESEELYKRILNVQPNDPNIFCNIGYSLYLQQRFSDSEECLRKAIALKADHLRAHNNLGLVLARTGRADEAWQEFRRAGCSEVDARTNLAYALTLNGSFTEASRHYQTALTLQPSSAMARDGLANINLLSARMTPTPPGQADHVPIPAATAIVESPSNLKADPAVVPASATTSVQTGANITTSPPTSVAKDPPLHAVSDRPKDGPWKPIKPEELIQKPRIMAVNGKNVIDSKALTPIRMTSEPGS